jgi:hypothetical protein
MFNLARNSFTVYYKLYEGKRDILDEYGNKTGSFEIVYSDLRSTQMSVSANKGTSEAEMFGTLDDYDRTMVTADTTCEIDEDSILWLDGADTNQTHNYIVKRRAPWKNSIAYAIKRVDLA